MFWGGCCQPHVPPQPVTTMSLAPSLVLSSILPPHSPLIFLF